MTKSWIRIVQATIYVINILWSTFLIWNSYKETSDVSTSLITVVVLLGSIIFNDLMK